MTFRLKKVHNWKILNFDEDRKSGEIRPLFRPEIFVSELWISPCNRLDDMLVSRPFRDSWMAVSS
jgi:hypothetical protein